MRLSLCAWSCTSRVFSAPRERGASLVAAEGPGGDEAHGVLGRVPEAYASHPAGEGGTALPALWAALWGCSARGRATAPSLRETAQPQPAGKAHRGPRGTVRPSATVGAQLNGVYKGGCRRYESLFRGCPGLWSLSLLSVPPRQVILLCPRVPDNRVCAAAECQNPCGRGRVVFFFLFITEQLPEPTP